MIYISFRLSNPWSRTFDNLWNQSGRLTENTSWELELLNTRELVGFELSYTRRQDHAGLRVELALFGYSMSFTIHDNRHWDSDTNNWEQYGKSN